MRSSKQRHLFPPLPHDNSSLLKSWGKWWSRYADGLGIAPSRKTFHSLRHTFKRACRDAGIGKEIHSELTGHATTDVGDTYGKIDGNGFSLKTLNEAIQKVSYAQ